MSSVLITRTGTVDLVEMSSRSEERIKFGMLTASNAELQEAMVESAVLVAALENDLSDALEVQSAVWHAIYWRLKDAPEPA